MTDKELIAGCKVQNRIAQKELYETYYSWSLNCCRRYARHRGEAEDWTQDIFLKIFDRIGRCKIDNLGGWLNSTVRNHCIDQTRKKVDIIFQDEHSYNETMGRLEDEVTFNFAFDDEVDGLTSQDVFDAVEKISPKYRATLNMYIMDGYTHQEIADELGIHVGTSKSNLFKAKKNVKILLDERLRKKNEAVLLTF